MSETVKVGIVGCGNISNAYFHGCRFFNNLEIIACADLLLERAQAKAEEWKIPLACDPETLLSHPDIEIIVNLTIPKAHGTVALAALEAGKSAYNEKPFALAREEGKRLLALAKEKGLRVGGAPDTFLGAGYQTCRKQVDDGAIGEPVAATAFMMGRGHESWHPDPEFYYKPGGGPMFDMGPYYLTALAMLLGPVRRVTGSAKVTFPQRTITSQPKHGQKIDVEVPTHVAGVADYHQGTTATILQSFDVYAAEYPPITIYGSEGTLRCPDPNGFGGPVHLWRNGEWQEVPLAYEYTQPGRGVGVADMAAAMRSRRAHRASGELAYHVLDTMHAFHDASEQDRHIYLESRCERPELLPQGDIQTALWE